MEAAEAFDFRVVFVMRVARLAAMAGRENAVVVGRVDKETLPFVKEEVARVVLVTTGSKKLVDVEACGFLGLTTEPLFHRENDRDFVRIHPVLVAERNRRADTHDLEEAKE
jgi:hypothetical protein